MIDRGIIEKAQSVEHHRYFSPSVQSKSLIFFKFTPKCPEKKETLLLGETKNHNQVKANAL